MPRRRRRSRPRSTLRASWWPDLQLQAAIAKSDLDVDFDGDDGVAEPFRPVTLASTSRPWPLASEDSLGLGKADEILPTSAIEIVQSPSPPDQRVTTVNLHGRRHSCNERRTYVSQVTEYYKCGDFICICLLQN